MQTLAKFSNNWYNIIMGEKNALGYFQIDCLKHKKYIQTKLS